MVIEDSNKSLTKKFVSVLENFKDTKKLLDDVVKSTHDMTIES